MIDVLMVVAGLILLFLGGEGLIKGAVSLARSWGFSKFLVSAIIIGFGTSMPEMTVSINAALSGSTDIALGNVVGSNIANILLIVGVGAVLAPISFSMKDVRRDTIVMLLASFALCGLSFLGVIHFVAGFLMLLSLFTYISWSYIHDKESQSDSLENTPPESETERPLSTYIAAFLSIGGLIVLVIGSYLTIEGASSMARDFGVPEAIIGLTVVAIGTSLPELATAVVAAMRKHSDIIIGNILGSNIFNVFAILGVTALVSPISFTSHIAQIDIWVMLGVAFLISFYLLRGKTIGRVSGGAMLASYVVYTIWLYVGTGL